MTLGALNDYDLAPKNDVDGKPKYIIEMILSSFTGTELKLSETMHNAKKIQIGAKSSYLPEPVGAIDFEWACTNTLRSFKLNIVSITEDHLTVITSRLAVMPKLKRVKLMYIEKVVKPIQTVEQ